MTASGPTSSPSEPFPATPSRSHSDHVRIWFQAVRFFSFTASVVPILVGSTLAVVYDEFDLPLFMAMLIASVACHAGANLANDYYDHRKGVDTPESLGPSKVIQQGLLTPESVRRGMVVAFAIATAFGLYIVWRTGWPILTLALASLAAAFLYTGGPKPLGYVALGEVTVFIFMGPVMVCGAYYVLTGQVTGHALALSLPIGFLVAAILHANNIRDIDQDAAAGKVTVATRLGRHRANQEYVLLIGCAYLAVAALVLTAPKLWPLLAVIATGPAAIQLCQLARSDATGLALNQLLRRTAGLHFQFGSIVAVALLCRALLDRLT